jgi:hypothetical protein
MREILVCAISNDPHTPSHPNTIEGPIMFYTLSWFFVVALLGAGTAVAAIL